MWYVFIHYASLRSKVENPSTSRDAEYSQLQSPARAPRECEKCSREGCFTFSLYAAEGPTLYRDSVEVSLSQ